VILTERLGMDTIDRWLKDAALPLDGLDPGGAEIVVLGELNHFVHEKSDFRIAMAGLLARRGYRTYAEELGWSDGWRLNGSFPTRDETGFDRLALFGHRGDARADRDDRPRGVFKASAETYPTALMRAEQTRFYRTLAPERYFGFDVAAGHDGGYADLAAMGASIARVHGETIAAEISRLCTARAAFGEGEMGDALDALIDGLNYTALVQDAHTYEATRPAMAFREDAMKRRLAAIRRTAPGPLVLMGHALHLAKDDALIDAPGAVGPGGDRVTSLGHHVTQELGVKTFSIWMLYGASENSQPLPDLPRRARFPAQSLNARLARRFNAPTLISTANAPAEPLAIGHMYNAIFRTPLRPQVDALYFIPRVTPMRA
jgi:erythromycin esterase-like protein